MSAEDATQPNTKSNWPTRKIKVGDREFSVTALPMLAAIAIEALVPNPDVPMAQDPEAGGLSPKLMDLSDPKDAEAMSKVSMRRRFLRAAASIGHVTAANDRLDLNKNLEDLIADEGAQRWAKAAFDELLRQFTLGQVYGIAELADQLGGEGVTVLAGN